MKITEEELEICRKLPPHKLEKGDWGCYREVISDSLVEELVTAVFSNGVMFACGDHISYDNIIHVSHPHQIMDLDKWPDEYDLGRNDGGWCIIEKNYDVKTHEWKLKSIVDYEDTARLACLRAIEPFLGGEEE